MAGMFLSGMEWTVQKLSSLLPSATPASSSSTTPSEGQTAALEDLRSLERTMKRIHSVLMEAHERDIRDHSEKFRLEELKEVAYDAEDVVADYEYDVLHAKIEARDEMLGFTGGNNRKERVPFKVIDLDSIKVSVPVSDEIACRVRAIRVRFEKISRDWETLRLSESDAPRRKNLDTLVRPPTSSLVQVSTIYGRDEDRDNIINQLLSEDGTRINDTPNVVSIVGMGGIGKTTLAQLVYNDARVCEHFELKGWVCVSENFDVVVLTKRIIESFTNKTCDKSEFNILQCDLKDIVQNKIFFLVLDDVWNENPDLWHTLCVPLTFAKFGTVLITTRSSAVANIVQTNPSYDLRHLNSEACWSLFKQLIFGNKEKNADKNQVEIAQKIVTKCCGLPLAVKTIGSVLRYEQDIESWIEIMESKELGSNIRNGGFLPVLKLSYDHMPSHLKRCFGFLALFPKDYVYQEDWIIKLWMSLELIHPKFGKSVEDQGRAYIKELQDRSMIQRDTQFSGQLQNGFVIHDLLHDLAQEVSEDVFGRRELKNTIDLGNFRAEVPYQLPAKVRYLSVVILTYGVINLQHFIGFPNLRVALLHCEHLSSTNPGTQLRIHNTVFGHLRNLRALDFRHSAMKFLPPSIGNLKQLRYLNLSDTGIVVLPESVCNLYNLEILELKRCFIYELPADIRKLSKLRHLNCYYHGKGPYYKCPYGIGLLTNLQSLQLFVVGENSSGCDIFELRDLLYLSGSLIIGGLQNVTNVNHAKEASLHKKQYLEDLTLDFGNPNIMTSTGTEFEEQLLETLKPHPNLKKLEIHGYGGSKFPRWVSNVSFSKLVELKLSNFACKELPPVGQLPSLKILGIHDAFNIIDIGPEFIRCHAEQDQGFQSLESLEIYSLKKLERWVGDRNSDFPKLEKIKIYYCDKLTRIGSLGSLSSLHLIGEICEELIFNSYLPQLKTLDIGSSVAIRNLSVSSCNFPLLQVLVIFDCHNLNSLVGLRSLTYLRKLRIGLCPRLYLDAAEEFPPSLEEYIIYECRCPDIKKKKIQTRSR